MSTRRNSRKRVDPKKLINFAVKVLQKLGVPEEHAQLTAQILVATDLRGIESHGVAHLGPFYAKWIKEGTINVKPDLEIFSQTPSTAVMDGDQGLGFVAGSYAMMDAIHRAERNGCGFLAVRNSTHCGAAFYYAMMALEQDMIGISLTAGGRLMIAPGSQGRAGGLNPIAVAVPADKKPPFVLDMSTSIVAAGKIEVARRQGNSIPEGWVINGKGNPITDPSKVNPTDPNWEGGFLPLGGTPEMGAYKGFGLAVLVDILCTVLSGAELGTQANHFFGAIRLEGFGSVDQFKKGIDELIESIESLEPLPGVEKVHAPGGPEAEIIKERKAKGIPLDAKVIQSLKDLAEETDVKYDISR